jgi:hypothetical protein
MSMFLDTSTVINICTGITLMIILFYSPRFIRSLILKWRILHLRINTMWLRYCVQHVVLGSDSWKYYKFYVTLSRFYCFINQHYINVLWYHKLVSIPLLRLLEVIIPRKILNYTHCVLVNHLMGNDEFQDFYAATYKKDLAAKHRNNLRGAINIAQSQNKSVREVVKTLQSNVKDFYLNDKDLNLEADLN